MLELCIVKKCGIKQHTTLDFVLVIEAFVCMFIFYKAVRDIRFVTGTLLRAVFLFKTVGVEKN